MIHSVLCGCPQAAVKAEARQYVDQCRGTPGVVEQLSKPPPQCLLAFAAVSSIEYGDGAVQASPADEIVTAGGLSADDANSSLRSDGEDEGSPLAGFSTIATKKLLC